MSTSHQDTLTDDDDEPTTATRPGVCPICTGRIRPGDRVREDPAQGEGWPRWAHEDCEMPT